MAQVAVGQLDCHLVSHEASSRPQGYGRTVSGSTSGVRASPVCACRYNGCLHRRKGCMLRPFAAQRLAAVFVALWAPFVAGQAFAGAAEFLVPPNGDTVIGVVTTAVAEHEDTLLDIGRRYGVGYEEIMAANPGVDPWLPGDGTEVLIPARFILPDAPREGIVVNLPEHRLYYFPPAAPGQPRVVRTYPISTGKMDWKTPLGITKV